MVGLEDFKKFFGLADFFLFEKYNRGGNSNLFPDIYVGTILSGGEETVIRFTIQKNK